MGKDDVILMGSSLITLIAIGVSLVMVHQLAGEISEIGERSERDLKEFKVLYYFLCISSRPSTVILVYSIPLRSRSSQMMHGR